MVRTGKDEGGGEWWKTQGVPHVSKQILNYQNRNSKLSRL